MTIANKSLSRFSNSVALTLGMFVAISGVFGIYAYSEKQIDRANELRLQSFLLADELRQSSDDLTRMARAYVVTEDSIYKQHYQEVLDIRDGKTPRPRNYNRIYWDLVLKDNQRPSPNGQAIALLELMRQAGFTDAEFAKLAQAKADSDVLTHAEFAAMALIDTKPITDENRRKAFSLLFDSAYYQAKADIMRPISEFYQMMDQRTLQAVHNAENMATLVRVLFILFGLLLMFTLWRAYQALYDILGCSVEQLQQCIARLGRGDFSSRIPVTQRMKNSVLAWLSETQVNLARIEAEREQAVIALRQSEERFQTMFRSHSAVMLLIDPETGSIIDANHAAEKFYGYSASALLDMNINNINQMSSDEISNERLKALVAQRNFFIFPHKLANGQIRIVEVHSTPIEQHRSMLLFSIIHDITEREQAEAELKKYREHLEILVEERTTALLLAKEAAEAANIAKSTFIATMSHELRTPLNAILGFSELMGMDNSTTAEQKETLTIINRSGAHLLSMINDVLDISKIEAGRLELNIQAFDLIKLLQDIGEMFRIRATNKQLTFKLLITANTPLYVKADNGKLRQVLINLLGNAIKFTQQGGVTLQVNTQPLSAVDTVMLNIEILDSGCGIPTDKLEYLFKPFMQLAQTNADVKGTGLGLAISKSLIELMGGRIHVKSVLGEGSNFKIELPVSITSIEDIIIKDDWLLVKSIAPNQPVCRLLVVDDNSDNRLLLVTLLSGAGFQVREVKNGQEAIGVFEQWQPHLIWMDMRMPVMDGYEATAKIRQLAGGNSVKIIALTASAFIEQHASIIKAGCDAVLYKPFHAPEIFAALTKHLGIKFIYENTAATLSSTRPNNVTAEMLLTLPTALQQQLHDAVLSLDTEETDVVIAEIHKIAPHVASGLQELAKHFQFEQLIQLTKTEDKQ